MQVVETKNEGLSREFSVTIEASDIEQRVETRLAEVGQTVNIPGFRPGKVPMRILKQRFQGAVMGEILEAVVGESSQNVLTENDIKPAMQPKIEVTSFDQDADLVFTMGVEIMPVIEPMDFSKLSLTRQKPAIGDDEVQRALEGIAKDMRATKPIEGNRKTKTGDVVIIDFVGTVGGEAFDGGSMEGHRLELGSGQFIPGFEDQLVGVKAGDHIDVEVTFPEEYGSAELAGKAAVFSTDVKEIHEYTDAEIDEEFAKNLGAESLDQVKDQIRERLAQDYGDVSRSKLKRELLDQLFNGHSFEVPAGMVDNEFDEIWRQFERARDADQIDEEDKDKDEEALRGEYRDIAHRRVLLGLLLSHVGETADIQITQDELNRAAIREAQRYPGQERQIFEQLSSNPEAMASLRAPLFEDKTVDYILELANVTDVEVTTEALMAEDDEAEDAPAKKTKAKKASKKSASKKSAAKKSAAKKAEKKDDASEG